MPQIIGSAGINTATAEGMQSGLDILKMSKSRFSLLIGAPEATVHAWVRGRRPVHPTAAKMLDWMLDGVRPETWHMTGDQLREAREGLCMTEYELADALDVETATIVKWESDFHGPPHFVATAVRWLQDGLDFGDSSTVS